MNQEELKKYMTFSNKQKVFIPIGVFELNGSYKVAVYNGTLSEFDIVVKYRQKINNKWSKIRTPKHIHWATDILIKLHENKKQTQEFLDFLLHIWGNTIPLRNKKEQEYILKDEVLLDNNDMIEKFKELSDKGEYSIKFLILLAKLLMIQEKTNLEDAFMFKNLLDTLRNKGDIFSVVSTASYNGR